MSKFTAPSATIRYRSFTFVWGTQVKVPGIYQYRIDLRLNTHKNKIGHCRGSWTAFFLESRLFRTVISLQVGGCTRFTLVSCVAVSGTEGRAAHRPSLAYHFSRLGRRRGRGRPQRRASCRGTAILQVVALPARARLQKNVQKTGRRRSQRCYTAVTL